VDFIIASSIVFGKENRESEFLSNIKRRITKASGSKYI